MSKMLGVMLDCSRNAVMKPEMIKKYADIIRKMGYNTMLLYTEDTYEIDDNPYFGKFRGRYSKAELKDIALYCQSIGIELIPCIQTLAHVPAMLKWVEEYGDIHDCADILIADEPKTYELIENMISSCAQCFCTNKIHLGMDEAINVGLGKYKLNHRETDRFEIIRSHLDKVCDIARKYGFDEPMIWNDMFLKLALDIEDQWADVDASQIREKAALDKDISLVYWNYYSDDSEVYLKNIKSTKLFERKVYFAGGTWTWRGISPDNTWSIKSTEAALKACEESGVVDGILFTLWGDEGAACSKFSVLPALMYSAQRALGNTDMDDIKRKFKEIVGCDFDTFMLLDKPVYPGGAHRWDPSVYLLFNDLFVGTRDYLCADSDSEYYRTTAGELGKADGGEYKYLFDHYCALSDALSLKCDLGKRLRAAYQQNDIEELKKLVSVCKEAKEKVADFYKIFKETWYYENKPYGLEAQDIRYGGLMQRIESCTERLEAYINGSLAEIPELAESMSVSKNGQDWFWRDIVSPNYFGAM